MSNKETVRPQDINEVKFYKKASLPWAILAIIAISVASFIGGWHMSQAHAQDVRVEASNIVDSLKGRK